MKPEDMTVQELVLEMRMEDEAIKKHTARRDELLKVLWNRMLPRKKLDQAVEDLNHKKE